MIVGKSAIFLGVFMVVFITGCYNPNQQLATCQLEYLLVDEMFFPKGAEVGEITSPLPEGTAKSAGRTIYLGKGVANHDIYPYATSQRALGEFLHYQQDPTFSIAPDEQWQIPKELTKLNLTANQYDLACGLQHNIRICKMIALYNNYFVFFSAQIYPDELTMSDLSSILLEIDRRMVLCLQNEQENH